LQNSVSCSLLLKSAHKISLLGISVVKLSGFEACNINEYSADSFCDIARPKPLLAPVINIFFWVIGRF